MKVSLQFMEYMVEFHINFGLLTDIIFMTNNHLNNSSLLLCLVIVLFIL